MRSLQSPLITSTTDTVSCPPRPSSGSMPQVPSTALSSTSLETIFGTAWKSYGKQTNRDIASDPLAALSLLDIPLELIVSIILYLPPHDIISCQKTCHKLNDVCNIATLRYLVQMERSGVSDDLRPGISYLERLLLLQRREEAWANLDFHKNVHVTVPFESTGTFDFTGGAFLLGTGLHNTNSRPTNGYSYFTLPSLTSTEDQKLKWQGLSMGIQILDVGLAVHEHDLIAVLTACVLFPAFPSCNKLTSRRKPDKNSLTDRHHTLEIRLLSFSTGEHHPLAEQPIILIESISLILGHCNVLIEIVGEYLALLITFQSARVANMDTFFLVLWKKGEAHRVSISRPLPSFDIKAPFVQLLSSEQTTYTCFSFLTEDTLVIPNLIHNHLGIVRIVVDESNDGVPRLAPLCTLGLPPLAPFAYISHLDCRAEPNPTGSGPLIVPAHSSRPFHDTAADAIVLFNLQTESEDMEDGDLFFSTTLFTFIVHRRALIAHIPCAQRACVPFRAVTGAEPTTVPWSAWGVPATRWFKSDPSSGWITTSAGQRAVMMEDRTPTPIIVRDFNPYAVRAALAQGQTQQECDHSVGEKSRVLPNGNRQTVKVEEDVIPARTIFREDVRSALPYIETVTQARYEYGGVMIDEERILGLEVRSLPSCVHVLMRVRFAD